MTKQERLILIKELIAKHQADFFQGLSSNNFNESELVENDLNLNDNVLHEYLCFYQEPIEEETDTKEDGDNKKYLSK